MKYLLLTLLIFSAAAFGNDDESIAQVPSNDLITTTDKTLDIDPESVSDEAVDKTGLYTNDLSMKAKVTCKTRNGREIKQGEKGYKKCIKNVKKKRSDVKVKFVK